MNCPGNEISQVSQFTDMNKTLLINNISNRDFYLFVLDKDRH